MIVMRMPNLPMQDNRTIARMHCHAPILNRIAPRQADSHLQEEEGIRH